MSIQYSNIIDPRLIEAINHVADAICKVADAIDWSRNNLKPVKNCGTCKYFKRKSLLEGYCGVNDLKPLPRRISTEPCIQYEPNIYQMEHYE